MLALSVFFVVSFGSANSVASSLFVTFASGLLFVVVVEVVVVVACVRACVRVCVCVCVLKNCVCVFSLSLFFSFRAPFFVVSCSSSS